MTCLSACHRAAFFGFEWRIKIFIVAFARGGTCAKGCGGHFNFFGKLETVLKGVEGSTTMSFLLDWLMNWINGKTATAHLPPPDPPARRIFQDLERRRRGQLDPTDLQIWVPPGAAFIGGPLLAPRRRPDDRLLAVDNGQQFSGGPPTRRPDDRLLLTPSEQQFIGGWVPSKGLLPSQQTRAPTLEVPLPESHRGAQATGLEGGHLRVSHREPKLNDGP